MMETTLQVTPRRVSKLGGTYPKAGLSQYIRGFIELPLMYCQVRRRGDGRHLAGASETLWSIS